MGAPTVLFVCTGNVCRSPMGEYLLRTRARRPVQVASAGMFALTGEPMDPPSAAALAELGVDGSAHRARQFATPMATAADLVLTAERAHADELLRQAPTLYRRTFTLREFARLAAPGGGADAVAAIAAAAARRGRVEVVPEREDDIADPFRGTPAAARATAEQVSACIAVVVRALRLDRPRPN